MSTAAIVVDRLKIGASLSYLWLMYVDRVDVDHHCLRCLKGHRSLLVDHRRRSYRRLVLDESPIATVYLCAVRPGGPLDQNVHLALRLSPGKVLDVDETNIKARVHNAQRLPITPWAEGSGRGPYFDRCRNWQFAKSFVAHDGLPPAAD